MLTNNSLTILYSLSSKDTAVRKACMDYIQYLALSDLLKVREQLSDTAACLCDDSFELRGNEIIQMTRLHENDKNKIYFFTLIVFRNG